MIRLTKLPYIETLEELRTNPYIEVMGETVSSKSSRVRCLIQGGGKCVECGLQGSFWAVEKHRVRDPYHINLYGLGKKGKEVMLTRDHIIPKSKGGGDSLINCQVLCSKCNSDKADSIRLGAAAFSTSSKDLKHEVYFSIKKGNKYLSLCEGAVRDVEGSPFKTKDLQHAINLYRNTDLQGCQIVRIWEIHPIEEVMKVEV